MYNANEKRCEREAVLGNLWFVALNSTPSEAEAEQVRRRIPRGSRTEGKSEHLKRLHDMEPTLRFIISWWQRDIFNIIKPML